MKMIFFQILQKFLIKKMQASQISNVILFKVQILDIFNNLLHACKNRETAIIRILSIENIKGNAVCPGFL